MILWISVHTVTTDFTHNLCFDCSFLRQPHQYNNYRTEYSLVHRGVPSPPCCLDYLVCPGNTQSQAQCSFSHSFVQLQKISMDAVPFSSFLSSLKINMNMMTESDTSVPADTTQTDWLACRFRSRCCGPNIVLPSADKTNLKQCFIHHWQSTLLLCVIERAGGLKLMSKSLTS